MTSLYDFALSDEEELQGFDDLPELPPETEQKPEEPEPQPEPEPDKYELLSKSIEKERETYATKFAALSADVEQLKQVQGRQQTVLQLETVPPYPTNEEMMDNPQEARERLKKIGAIEDRNKARRETLNHPPQPTMTHAEQALMLRDPEGFQRVAPKMGEYIARNVTQFRGNEITSQIQRGDYSGLFQLYDEAKASLEPKPSPEDVQKAKEDGIKLEQSRQNRLKQGAMHGGQRGGNQSKITLDAMDRKTIQILGIPEEEYIKSKRLSVPGWGGA